MKVKIPLAVLLVLAAAVGYLMGTESGRQRRELVLVKLRRADGTDDAEVELPVAGGEGD